MSGYVYILGCRSIQDPLAKIGFTTRDPRIRLRELKTGNGDELFLAGYREGTLADERALHLEFADYRVCGEWFRLVPETLDRFDKLVEEWGWAT